MKVKKSMREVAIVLIFLLFMSFLFANVSCNKDHQKPEESTTRQTNQQGYSNASDFVLTDQFGKSHKLSDYKDKIVYLTFWATWSQSCKQQLPDLEQLYKDRGMNTGDVVVLGVVLPSKSEVTVESEEPQEQTADAIKEFLRENHVTFPVLMDEDGKVFLDYAITGLPTTFLIDREGYFIGVIPASIERAVMDHFIEDALDANHNDA